MQKSGGPPMNTKKAVVKAVTHTQTPWKVENGLIVDSEGQQVWNIGNNTAFIVRAVNLHEELLSIIRALDEQFKAGADKVYRDALAPHTDDLTLAQWIDQTLQKA